MRIEEVARVERALLEVSMHGTEDMESSNKIRDHIEKLEKARDRIEDATAQVWKVFPQ